jgi:hypothetical protein
VLDDPARGAEGGVDPVRVDPFERRAQRVADR